ncbi:ATP-dependent RNA helicase ddx24 [Dermatophagoides pteronyssinus]|uniref:ATP-dependent RNA helicase n=1 Tax=Dermatophagoides pteronyssinus TaxID=6956 RepID=A0ABQ8IZ53_DERPT|nr:ATP-dependent RNA helicase ddx24 [Dermatophagoides pteronyssinus]
MPPKRKSNHEHRWKPMKIECDDGLTAEDFQGLVAIEELDSYHIIHAEPSKKSLIIDNDKSEKEMKQKRKKKKLSNNINTFDVSRQEIEIDNEEDKDLDMSHWGKLSVPAPIIQCLRSLRMSMPTSIQSLTIPAAINDHMNIYGAAPTGSGKTLAFAIPIVDQIIKEMDEMPNNPKLRSIILTPTRELAVQIKQHIDNICKFSSKIKVALIVGGLAIQKQQRILSKQKPQIIVATPGRLWEMLTSKTVPYLNRESLITDLRSLVIDEADRMIEKSHFRELRFIIDFFKNDDRNPLKSGQCQVFIFSATLTMNRSIKNKQHHRLSLKKSDQDSIDLIKLLSLDRNTVKICDLTDGGQKSKPDAEHLTESIIHCQKDDKDLYLYYFVLNNPGRTIVFCNSIDCIRRLLNLFRFLKMNPLSIHSSMPQKRRLTNIERFTATRNSLLFATDIASRGLDIPNIDHVVHYQVPRSADIYVHRSGRTARINNKGFSLILCDPKEDAFFLRDFSKIIHKESIAEYSKINVRILKRLKERIRLAQVCDMLEHKLRKNRTETNWFRTNAEACEIIYDSDEQDDGEHHFDDEIQNASIRERKDCERKLKTYEHELSILLKKPLNFRSINK